MGCGKVVPASNDTWWNSTFRQLCCIAALDQSKMTVLLHEQGHENLILATKELQRLEIETRLQRSTYRKWHAWY